MRHAVVVVSSLALVTTIGCASSGSSTGGTATAASSGGGPALKGLIQPLGASLTGQVTIAPTSRDGELRVAMTVRGSSAGQRHPWHVHSGRCDATGPILGSTVAYPLLEIRGDGTVDITRTIRARLDPLRSYYVDIHASSADMDRILGCADLVATQ